MAADFEEACEELDIPLHVLPPRRPQWNGCVERTNRSARAEFWSLILVPGSLSDFGQGRLAECRQGDRDVVGGLEFTIDPSFLA